MMKIEIVQQRVYDQHGDVVKICEETYEGYKKHAIFIDEKFGMWRALVYSVCRGTGHPDRHRSKIELTYEKAQMKLGKKHHGVIKIKPETWTHTHNKCTFIDQEFGEWETTFAIAISGKGHPERVKQYLSESQTFTDDEVQKRLDEAHHGTVKLIGPYQGAGIKCKFLDIDFGEFEAFPVNVLRGTGHLRRAVQRRENTMLQRTGMKHHMQTDIGFFKQQRKLRHHYKDKHWKTNQELDCTGTWELKVVQWLNERKEDFIWQPRAFKMPDGRTYRPDAYLIERNIWIDIKGYFPEKWQDKCNWFKTIMPNFEIWDKPKLLQLGIHV